tara:strand:+ start:47 stop:490 length:444 start_codon:yes stop_codon:yes gene_type:complete
MDKDFIRPEDILNKSQYDKYKNSTICLYDGCEKASKTWSSLTCQEHEQEQMNKYQKCCQDECYNLIKNQNGKWAACSECREKHKSDNDVEIKEDFKTDEYGFTDPLENEFKKLELENEKLHKAFDKLLDAFMKLNASNDKLIDKLLN